MNHRVQEERTEIEQRLAELHQAGRHDEAAAEIVRVYGPEVLGYLARVLGAQDQAEDVFQHVCAQVIRGLPSFRRQASFRTWVYVIARRSAQRGRAAAARSERPLELAPEVAAMAERVRTETAPYLRTEVKDAFRALRAQLSEEEQSLLVLRVDRGLEWSDLALVWAEGEGDDLRRLEARLRKKFQRTKDKLRRLAEAEGLLGRMRPS